MLALPALLGLLALAGCRSSALRVDAPAPGAQPVAAVALPASSSPSDDVRALTSADFTARSLASQRLVKAGAASLPLLGAAGPQETAQPGSRAESSTAPVIAAILADLPTQELVARLSDPYASVREAAANEAGRRKAWDAVPTLIDGLGDPSPEVRTSAREALKRISGEMGDPLTAGAPRAGLQQRWRTWWSQVGRARAAATPRRG